MEFDFASIWVVVFTQNWRNYGAGLLDERGLVTLSRRAAIKASYTYRF